ncbi:hypothetical protein LTR97_009018 [Elasticomyces elasticus]|uniref:Uncharacterized protein n=1 Tax=Elasticomyces elasticus TaxID=574655 RepID=A0AAN8A1M4_9PEZI|nr:hypothetical protein LTR97_009018 [Elasticomyces elasticus]
MSTSTASVLQEATNIIPCVVPELPELAVTVRLFLFLYIFTSFIFASVAAVVYHWEPISHFICKISESTIDAIYAYVKRKAAAGKEDLEVKSPFTINTHEQGLTVKTIQDQASSIRDQHPAAPTAQRKSLFFALSSALDDIHDQFPRDASDMARLTHSYGIARLLDRAVVILNNIQADAPTLWSDERDDTRIYLEEALELLDSQGHSLADASGQSELLKLRVKMIESLARASEDDGKHVGWGEP